jgi:hypothetical protein
MGLMVQQVQRALKDLKELQAQLDLPVQQVLQVQPVRQVQRVLKD